MIIKTVEHTEHISVCCPFHLFHTKINTKYVSNNTCNVLNSITQTKCVKMNTSFFKSFYFENTSMFRNTVTMCKLIK